jgi:hypothetical protein
MNHRVEIGDRKECPECGNRMVTTAQVDVEGLNEYEVFTYLMKLRVLDDKMPDKERKPVTYSRERTDCVICGHKE